MFGAIASLAGPVIGGYFGAEGAKDAARIQAGATEQGIGEQAREYNQSRADSAPYREAGVSAVARIRDLLGLGSGTASSEDIMKLDPGYEFRLGEGMRGITNPLRSSGMLKSGAALKAAMRYGQNFATNAYDSVFNRLSGLAGTGQTATNASGQLGAQYAGNIGNLLTGGANARGAAAIGASNAWGGAANTIGNYYGQNAMLDRILGNRSTPTSSFSYTGYGAGGDPQYG